MKHNYYVFFLIALFHCSCKIFTVKPNGIVNYGFVNSFINTDLRTKFELPSGFVFTNHKFSVLRKLTFSNYDVLFSADQKFLTNYKIVALVYNYSHLDDFSTYIVKNLQNNTKIDSIKKITKSYTQYLVPVNKLEINYTKQYNIYEYIVKSKKNRNLHVIEQHIIDPTTNKILRLIWVSDFNHIPKGIFSKESFYRTSADVLSSITFSIPTEDPFWLASSNFNFNSGFNYNFPVSILDNLEKNFEKADFQKRSSYLQAQMTFRSFAGEFKSVSQYDSELYKLRSDSEDVLQVKSYDTISAVKYILESARTHKVLMFNEAHHWPQCRAFVRDMLADLKALGYNKLALEALTNNINKKQNDVLPNQQIGFYTSEPVYGQLLREATRLGFTILAYEDTIQCKSQNGNECSAQREQNEAQNLYNVFKSDSGEKNKLIVLAGYDHIKKQPSTTLNPMAYNFIKISGIVPACFDLSEYHEKTTTQAQSEVYTDVIKKFQPLIPIILINKKHEPFVNEADRGMVDANVFLPSGSFIESNLPFWYKQKDSFQYTLTFKSKTKAKSFLQIYVQSERQKLSWNAVPYINCTLAKGVRSVELPLQPNINYIYNLKQFSSRTTENGSIILTTISNK